MQNSNTTASKNQAFPTYSPTLIKYASSDKVLQRGRHGPTDGDTMNQIIFVCNEPSRSSTRAIKAAAAKAGENLWRYLEEHRAAPETLHIIAGMMPHERLMAETIHKTVPKAMQSPDDRLTQRLIEQPDDLGAQIQRIDRVIDDNRDSGMTLVLILEPERLTSFFRSITKLRFGEHDNFNPGDIVALEFGSSKYTSYHST